MSSSHWLSFSHKSNGLHEETETNNNSKWPILRDVQCKHADNLLPIYNVHYTFTPSPKKSPLAPLPSLAVFVTGENRKT